MRNPTTLTPPLWSDTLPKLHKETKWLVLAALAFLFLFERSDTLTVENGYVRLYRRTWWFYTREVKSAEASSIVSVTHISRFAGKSSANSLVIKGKDGKIFYDLLYRGIFGITAKRAHNDQIACKKAIAEKSRFSRTTSTTLPFPHVALVVSLFVYWYKRSWRIHDEREEMKALACAEKAARLKDQRECVGGGAEPSGGV